MTVLQRLFARSLAVLRGWKLADKVIEIKFSKCVPTACIVTREAQSTSTSLYRAFTDYVSNAEARRWHVKAPLNASNPVALG